MNSTILTTLISSGIASLGVFVSIILSRKQIDASNALFHKQIKFEQAHSNHKYIHLSF